MSKSQDKTIVKLQKLGYTIMTQPTTQILEPFTSDITDKKYLKEIGYSSKENDIKFLEECLGSLVNNSKTKK